jgi:hypothetical protein
MTDPEWRECREPQAMLALLRNAGKLSERKARLFAAACCRRIWHLIVDERLQEAVAVAENHADGKVGDEAMSDARDAGLAVYRAAYEHLTGHPPPEIVSMTRTDQSGQTGVAAWLSDHPPVEAPVEAPSSRAAATSAAEAVLRAASTARLLPWTACELAADAAAGGWRLDSQWPVEPMAQRAECAAQAVLLRDLFGSLPFRPVLLPPSVRTWNGGTVRRLAEAAYEQRLLPAGTLEQERLMVLADAIEEAGARDQEVLQHLREQKDHWRGCWAVDLLLGKE